MKRIREEVYATSSQFKRPFHSSRDEFYGQSQIPAAAGGGVMGAAGGGGGGGCGGGGGSGGGNSQKLTTNDALTYLKEVKEIFQDQKEKYEMFLEVMKDFKAQKTDTVGVIARVKELFKGHNNLIFGFNTFLPKGYEITLDEDETPVKKTVEFEEAINFVNKIKQRFQSNEQVYKSFLDILNMYRKEQKDISEVYSEVAALFENHPDLLNEFTRFLPDTSGTAMDHVHYGRNTIQRNSTAPNFRMHMDKQRRQEKVGGFHAERDRSVDRPDLDDDKSMMKLHKEQRRHIEKENKDRKHHDQDDREPEHDSMQRFPDKKKFVRKVEAFGTSSNLSPYSDKDALKSMYNVGFIFCEKVKEKLDSSDDYQAFLKCLNIFSNGIIKRNDLQNLVTDLLGKYPELMDEFNDFLERCENIDGFLAGVMSKKSLSIDGHVSKPLKVEDKKKGDMHESDGGKEKEKCKEKYMWKSIQELDLSDCEHCTPSYRLLPDDYPIPVASHRSDLGAEVLNDHWVSVTSGSEDYSFKHMRRNQYEENLFRCEDDRFEMDMLLESVISTAKSVEELLQQLNENRIENPFHVEDHLTALNLRCIERLYGDHGLDAMDILHKNPSVALPVILIRLKQKQEEWTRCRTDFNKVWAEIYAKNHYKSLDHRSFYFKQHDSKTLSIRSFVAEIKELKMKQLKDEDFALAFATGSRLPMVPNLKYNYFDVSIHEDLYKLVNYSCKEILSTKEQLNKVMRLWTTFMEPMLGIVSHSSGIDSSEDRGKSKSSSSSSLVENGGTSAAEPSRMNTRQSESASNGNENTSPHQVNVSKIHLGRGEFSSKENNLGQSDHPCKDETASNMLRSEPEHKNIGVGDRISGVSTLVAAVQEVADSRTSTTVVVDQSHGRPYPVVMTVSFSTPTSGAVNSEDQKSKGGIIAGPLVEGAALQNQVSSENQVPVDGTTISSHQKSVSPSKTEKEEGELSPNADYGEDNFVVEADVPKEKHSFESRQPHCKNGEEASFQDAMVENDVDADADDEDGENASEAGSEPAGDDCSGEEHEEDEDVGNNEIDGNAESEGEGEWSSEILLHEHFRSVKPVRKHVPTVSVAQKGDDPRVFYGNDDFYVLFRLHQILYERILFAKTNCTGAETGRGDASSVFLYERFLNALYCFLDGSVDNTKFEDECRSMIGNQSYVLFTLDKLIYKLVRQLQTIATEETDGKLLQLYDYEKSRQHKKSVDFMYYDNARFFLHEENIYRLEFLSTPSRCSIQLMDNINEKSEIFPVSVDLKFAKYLHDDYLSAFPSKKELQGIILWRNKRKYAALDEISALSKAMDGVNMYNGLECKSLCNSCKTSYVLDTEDVLHRPRRRRRNTSPAKCRARFERYQGRCTHDA